MANSRREVVFVPTGLLASGGLEPGALQAGGHRKTIGHSGILLVVEIPGLAIGRGNEGRGFTKVRADGWSRLGIWSQQAGRSADPDGFARSPLQRRIALILSISLGLSFDGQLNSLMERIKQGSAELTRPMLPLMNWLSFLGTETRTAKNAAVKQPARRIGRRIMVRRSHIIGHNRCAG